MKILSKNEIEYFSSALSFITDYATVEDKYLQSFANYIMNMQHILTTENYSDSDDYEGLNGNNTEYFKQSGFNESI